MSYQEPDTAATMLEIIRSLRADPEKYQALRKELSGADSDEARVKAMLKFADSERDLAALVPAGSGPDTQMAWTTVTVTTIFIADSAY